MRTAALLAVNPQYRRKIEAVVRKRAQADELPEEMTPCVRCEAEGPEVRFRSLVNA